MSTNKATYLETMQTVWHMRRIRSIHFVGIGGVGMSGIAEVLLNQGYMVSGSDLAVSAVTKHLEKLSATIYYNHSGDNVNDADVVVYSSAVTNDNVELIAAKEQRIPVISRAEMLAELMRFGYGIAIAGTHGKTTTTSLVASLLAEAGLSPTFVIGGRLNSVQSHACLGAGHYFVAEADESDASFLSLQPMVAIITNIDHDHMGTYDGDFAKLRQAFLDFIHHLPFYGLAIVCVDDAQIRALLPQIKRPCITYGFHESADIRASNYQQQQRYSSFNLVTNSGEVALKLNLPGRHNVANALAAIALALEEGVSEEVIRSALKNFSGIGRRFQIYEDITILGHNITLIDDYGHHPSEVQATYNTLIEGWPEHRIVVVFQPHRFSRTRDLFEDFVQVLSAVDTLVLLDVYPAGEQAIPGADGRTLCRAIRLRGQTDPIFVSDNDSLPSVLSTIVQEDDILLLQGAGSIGQISAQIRDHATNEVV